MMNELALYRHAYAPTGSLDDYNPARIIADAMSRARRDIATERDAQVTAAVATAMAELQRRAPAFAAQLTAQFQAAAIATSQRVMDEALRRAATALLQAEPWLSERVVAAARQSGAGATESGLATAARTAAPWLIGGLVVFVAVYGISTYDARRQ
jgi:cell division septum initiation protein DivIVA